jgi:hypothetical protein
MVSESDVEDYLLGLMNNERTSNGLPAYVRDIGLDAGARAHTDLVMARAMLAPDPSASVCPPQINVVVQTWTESWQEDHWCPADELSPIQRIQPDWQTLYGIPPTENVGSGWANISPPDPTWEPYENIVLSIHQYFMAEVSPNDGHRRAILNPDFNSVGVGVRIFTRTVFVGGVLQQQAYVRFTVDFAKI